MAMWRQSPPRKVYASYTAFLGLFYQTSYSQCDMHKNWWSPGFHLTERRKVTTDAPKSAACHIFLPLDLDISEVHGDLHTPARPLRE